jgi:hypothetical protein
VSLIDLLTGARKPAALPRVSSRVLADLWAVTS